MQQATAEADALPNNSSSSNSSTEQGGGRMEAIRAELLTLAGTASSSLAFVTNRYWSVLEFRWLLDSLI